MSNAFKIKIVSQDEDGDPDEWGVYAGTQLLDTFDTRKKAQEYIDTQAIDDAVEHFTRGADGLSGPGDPRPS